MSTRPQPNAPRSATLGAHAHRYARPVTSSNKRDRQLAKAKYERQQTRRQVADAKRRRNQRIIAVVVVAALVIGFGGWVILARLTSSNSAQTTAAPAASSAVGALASAAAAAASAAPASAAPAVTLACAQPGTPRANDVTFDAAPDIAPTAGSITLTTNCGDIVIETLPDAAPSTVASMQFLAGKEFFDNTACHRVTTEGIYVLQCGDPAGDGTGGPGYSIPDENLPQAGEANYPAGTVAMANAGAGTGGSQFFVVYQDTTLPPNYSIWGNVTSGLDLVSQIASAGVEGGGGDGRPAQPVFIQSASTTAP